MDLHGWEIDPLSSWWTQCLLARVFFRSDSATESVPAVRPLCQSSRDTAKLNVAEFRADLIQLDQSLTFDG